MNTDELVEHVMTKEQAKRFSPNLEGETVLCIIREDMSEEAGLRVASDVYYNGVRVFGNFCLDD